MNFGLRSLAPDSIVSELGLTEGTELLSVNGRALKDFLDWGVPDLRRSVRGGGPAAGRR